jgi:hypothetical protein
MSILSTIKSKISGAYESLAVNVRDIVSTLFWITLILLITQIIASIGDGLKVDLHDIKSFVFAIGKFAAVTLCGVGYLAHVTFRQSLGSYDLNEFMDTWKYALSPKERLEWFFKVSCVGIIAAAIVFSIGV